MRRRPRGRVAGLLAATAAIGAGLLPVSGAQADSRDWHGCSRAATNVAAALAGVPAALNADPSLRSVFGTQPPAVEFNAVHRGYCADFDGDGDIDRAATYVCCSVSSPSPVVILRNNSGSFAIVYKRFDRPVFRFGTAGRALVVREPKYSSSDANCCPSRYRVRTLRWTGTRIKSTVRIRHA